MTAGAFDTHCHLQDPKIRADFHGVMARARAAGVIGVVLCGYDAPSNVEAIELSREEPGVYPAVGFHPHEADSVTEEMLAALESQARAPEVVAVGEIGLDFFVEGHDAARQEWFFAEQLKLARKYELPVLLHIRRAQDAVLKNLRRIAVPGGIAHAFNGSRQQADAFIRLGFRLGFGGALTYPRARRIREHAANLPMEAIVLETDGPDIPPEFAPRTRNDPANLPRIATVLAELRGMALDELALRTTSNALAVMPRLALDS